jgi:hypothetical protein
MIRGESMSDLSVCSVVAVSPNQVSSDLDGEVVILNLHSGVYHGLEEVGARVWGLIREPAPVRHLRDALLDEYDVEPLRCEEDLIALLGELKDHGLLEVRHDADRQVHGAVPASATTAFGSGDPAGAGAGRIVAASVLVAPQTPGQGGAAAHGKRGTDAG